MRFIPQNLDHSRAHKDLHGLFLESFQDFPIAQELLFKFETRNSQELTFYRETLDGKGLILFKLLDNVCYLTKDSAGAKFTQDYLVFFFFLLVQSWDISKLLHGVGQTCSGRLFNLRVTTG